MGFLARQGSLQELLHWLQSCFIWSFTEINFKTCQAWNGSTWELLVWHPKSRVGASISFDFQLIIGKRNILMMDCLEFTSSYWDKLINTWFGEEKPCSDFQWAGLSGFAFFLLMTDSKGSPWMLAMKGPLQFPVCKYSDVSVAGWKWSWIALDGAGLVKSPWNHGSLFASGTTWYWGVLGALQVQQSSE